MVVNWKTIKQCAVMIGHIWGFLDELNKGGEGRKDIIPAPGEIGTVSENCVQWHRSLLPFD